MPKTHILLIPSLIRQAIDKYYYVIETVVNYYGVCYSILSTIELIIHHEFNQKINLLRFSLFLLLHVSFK